MLKSPHARFVPGLRTMAERSRAGNIGLLVCLAWASLAIVASARADTVSSPLAEFDCGSLTSNVAISPDGAKFLTGADDGTVQLWEISTGQEIRAFTGHKDLVSSVAFSRDGTKVLTGSEDGTAKLWNVSDGKEIRTFEGAMGSAALSPDDTMVVAESYDEDSVTLWNVADGKVIRSFDGAMGPAAFSPDGAMVIAASDEDASVTLWDASTGGVVRDFKGSMGPGLFSPDGTKVLSGLYQNSATLWNASTGAEIRSFSGQVYFVASLGFSPDGTKIVTGSYDGTAKLWNAGTGAELRTFSGHTDLVTSVTFSPDGTKVLTASSDGTVRLWASGPIVNTQTTVPNVLNRAETAATASIAAAGLVPGTVIQHCSETVDEGNVISQNPAAGKTVSTGSAVALTISSGSCAGEGEGEGEGEDEVDVIVPNVVGQTQSAATASITNTGLTVGATSPQCSNTVAAGSIVGQTPAADVYAAGGSSVALTVSSGPCGGEGEGEGEGEPVTPPTEKALREKLTVAFEQMDSSGDGKVSYKEAEASLPGLTQEVFTAVDTNHDGQISRTEAGLQEDNSSSGCNASHLASNGTRNHLGDLLLVGAAMCTLAAMRRQT